MKAELVFGRIPVRECLRAGKRRGRAVYLLRDGKGLGEFEALGRDIPITVCSRQELDGKAGGQTHQGVILEADPLPVLALGEWDPAGLPQGAFAVLLDGIEDPHNFGAVVRSAAACGASAVVFGKDRAAPISPVVVKAAAGGVEYVDLVRVTNLVRAIETLQGAGFWVYGMDAAGDRVLWEADLTGRTVLVIGGEGTGLRRLVRERCDGLLRIPLSGPISSLNASVSAAIGLAECLRQRGI